MLAATSTASSSGWRISLISSLTLRVVSRPTCWRSASTFAPPLPITMPGLAVWTVTVDVVDAALDLDRLTLALASRPVTSLRIVMSS